MIGQFLTIQTANVTDTFCIMIGQSDSFTTDIVWW